MALTKPDLTGSVFRAFPDMKAAVIDGLCPTCGLEIKEEDYRDEASREEYSVSGVCQTCWDQIYRRVKR